MSKQSARDRLAEAAFALFAERGYEQTSIDDITERAGLGRTTFFRHYRSKEDVIFPDHDLLLAQIGERLRTSSDGTALLAVSDAVRLVLKHYVEEGDLARRRYALTSGGARPPGPRDRQRRALPAAVPRVHRRLDGRPGRARPAAGRADGGGRGRGPQPRAPALAPRREPRPDGRGRPGPSPGHRPVHRPPAGDPATGADGTTIVAFRTGQDIEALLPALRRLADNVPSTAPLENLQNP